MYDLVLVDPPWYRLFGSHYNTLPLGIGYISSYLQSKGFSSIIYNSDYENNNTFLTQYDRVRQYNNYIRVLNDEDNKIWRNIVKDIINLDTLNVGFTICQPTLKSALILSKLLKRENPNLNIIFGGPQITVNPITYENVDHIVTGEGEIGILEAMAKNSSYKCNGPTIDNLDTVPFPDRENVYFKGKYLEYNNIITGRGCPFNCIFCGSRVIWKNKFRLRSVENVIQELKLVKDKYGCNDFNFRDDTFTITNDRTHHMCRELKKLDITWGCDTRVDNLTFDILKEMKESGCNIIRIGVESGNERILKMIKKGIKKEKVKEVVENAHKVGIKVTTYFMVGFPTETEQEVRDSLNFAREIDPDDIGLSIATPYHGTELMGMMNYNENEIEKYFHQSPDILNRIPNKEVIYEFYDFANNKRKKRFNG
jgi:anaerobic magnesium-protoporphyrin IX monomethyl ester cyclase